jgi:hypothetical protein
MSNEDKFKENLQRLVDSKEFHFVEADWDRARNFIDEQRRGNRRRIGYISLLILSLAGTTWTALNWNNTDEAKPTGIVARKQSEKAANVPQEEMQGALKPGVTTKVPQQLAESSQPKHPEKHEEPVRNVIRQPVAEEIGETQAAEEKQQVFAPEPVQSFEEPVQVQISVKKVTYVRKEEKDKHEMEIPRGEPVGSGVIQTISEPKITTALPPVTKNDEEYAEIKQIASAQENKQNETVHKNENEAPLVAAVSQTSTPAGEEKETPLSVVNVATPAAAPDSVKKFIPLIPDKPKEILLSVEGGGAFLAGWRMPDKTDARGLNPVFGVNYHNYLTREISVSFGLQYNRVNNLESSSVTAKATRYSLGEESTYTTITPVRLHYLTVPLRLHYQLNDMNSFGIGYSVGYLLNTEATVYKYKMQAGKKTEEESYVTGGYTEGFKLFDSQASVFYERILYKNISVKAELFYGFSDVKDDGFFKIPAKERNKGIRLMAVYNIYRR